MGWGASLKESDLMFDRCLRSNCVYLLKSFIYFFIFGSRGLEYENNLQKIMGCESFRRVGFDHHFKINLFLYTKMALHFLYFPKFLIFSFVTPLVLVIVVQNVKTTSKKSQTQNLL